jgi:hypothetical protein
MKCSTMVSVVFHDMTKKAESVVALRFLGRGYDEKGQKRHTM